MRRYTFILINRRLTPLCLVSLQIPLCLLAPEQKSLIQLKVTMDTCNDVNFQFLTENTLFAKIWSKKSKLLIQAVIWYSDQFKYAEFNSGIHFFCFRLEKPFLGEFGRKNKSCQFELKLGTDTNLNIRNLVGVLTFFIFDRKYLFLGKFCSKNQNCLLELKFGTKTNLKKHNSLMMLNFSIFNQK